jgi:hypothetical protein
MNVTVVLIHHNNGEDVRVTAGKKAGRRALAKYAREQGAELFRDKPRPSDEEMIDAYFHKDQAEWYEEIDFDVRSKRKAKKFNWLNP